MTFNQVVTTPSGELSHEALLFWFAAIIITSLVSLAGVLAVAILGSKRFRENTEYSRKAAHHAEAVDRAVNSNEYGEERLYKLQQEDHLMTRELYEWMLEERSKD